MILSGCGGASSESSSQASPSAATIQLESPAVQDNGVISPDVACGAGTIWLPLKWSDVPSGTEEMILYFGRFRREDAGGAQRVRVPFAAMLTGISPELHGMAANTFPAGSEPVIFGTSENCQTARIGQKLLVELFALGAPGGCRRMTTSQPGLPKKPWGSRSLQPTPKPRRNSGRKRLALAASSRSTGRDDRASGRWAADPAPWPRIGRLRA